MKNARALALRVVALLLAVAPLGPAARAAGLRHETLDDFRDAEAWTASASDQVHAALRRDRDGGLCLDADFAGVSGYAVMRRQLPVDWPAQFDLVARLKGGGAANDLQLKLVDAGGDNVWWVNRPHAVLPRALADWKFKRRHFDFAWGPAADHALRRTQAIEFVLAAGRAGGRSSLCVAKLTLVERAPDPAVWPTPVVRRGARQLDIDWGLVREFNGVALHWPAGASGLDYELLASDDARQWRCCAASAAATADSMRCSCPSRRRATCA